MKIIESYIKEYNDWEKIFETAEIFMQSRKGNKILIECAAQHPLIDGEFPGEEFEKRLLLTIELYKKLTKEGNIVKIYVPGSRHKYYGVADKVSLSLSGKKYLVNHGIPAIDIFSVRTNLKYKGLTGVYNSADECFVASMIFKDENFDKLISVGSPAQMYRKTLFYVKNGVMPINYSVPSENMFHNYFKEIFSDIPKVIFEDNDCQGNDSKIAINSRNDRCPYLVKTIENIEDMKEENFNLKEFEIDKNESNEEKKLESF